jgi:hypothetical protein
MNGSSSGSRRFAGASPLSGRGCHHALDSAAPSHRGSCAGAAAAANRRDFELFFLNFEPEFEMSFDESAVGGFVPPDLVGVHRGHEAFLRVWEAGIEAIDLKVDYDEVIDFGDRVLLCGRQLGRGRASGIPVDQPLFQVFTLRRGLLIREQDFTDRDKALEAAGLLE